MEQGKFRTFDGLQLYFRYFQKPDSRDLLLTVHGHGEHSGRYEKFEARLKNTPVSLACFDARGNGRSEGRPVFLNSFEDYLKDVDAYERFLRKTYQTPEKIILLGHSLGALVAINWATRNSGRVKGLILSSPCFGLNLPGWVCRLNEWVRKTFPGFYYSHPVYPPHLTHNLEEVEVYKKDPWIQRKMTPALLCEMLSESKKLQSLEKIVCPWPVFIMASGLEKIVDLKATKSVFEKIEAPQKKLEIFPALYHEIFNEIEQDEVFEVLGKFIQKTIDNRP